MTVPSAAGTGSPLMAMATSSPVVFSATVLPPAFGPLITSAVLLRSSATEIGMTFRSDASSPNASARAAASRSSSSGWRPSIISRT